MKKVPEVSMFPLGSVQMIWTEISDSFCENSRPFRPSFLTVLTEEVPNKFNGYFRRCLVEFLTKKAPDDYDGDTKRLLQTFKTILTVFKNNFFKNSQRFRRRILMQFERKFHVILTEEVPDKFIGDSTRLKPNIPNFPDVSEGDSFNRDPKQFSRNFLTFPMEEDPNKFDRTRVRRLFETRNE